MLQLELHFVFQPSLLSAAHET